MLTVTWGYMPTEVRTAFAPILERYLWLVPGWCRLLYVAYNRDGSERASASCSADPEYRQASIILHGPWMDDDPVARKHAVVHELLHIPLAPMVMEQEKGLDLLLEEKDAPKFRKAMQEQWRQRFEGTVQDLALAVQMIPNDYLPKVQYASIEDEHPPATHPAIPKAA